MPKIAADTVAEHVTRQRAAVLEAAVRLFTERGYSEVGIGDIATEVGLARNSLYRYVPDKASLLVEWFRATVPRTIDQWQTATAGDDAAAERLTRWAHVYLDWARSPEHQLVAPLVESLDSLDADVREEVSLLHRSMLDVVARIVAEAGVADAEVAGTVQLLSGIVLGAARAEADTDGDPATDAALRARMDRAILATVITVDGTR